MTDMALWVWAAVATVWALVATVLHFRNPLPFPDRGHRLYGVADERARRAVVRMLGQVSHLKEQFTFDSGTTHQTLMWDGFTVINYLDPAARTTLEAAGTGLSVPAGDPRRAAAEAVKLLRESGYEAEALGDVDPDLPENYLIPVKSNAFDGWVLVFRRPLIKMPFPKKRSREA